MANVYRPRLLQVRPQYTPNQETGETPQNILWFLSGGSALPSAGDLGSIQATFDTNWANFWKVAGTNEAHYTGSVITDWSSSTGLEVTSVASGGGSFTPVAGTKGSPLPESVALLVSYHTTLRWRGGHFRTYLPWVGQDSLSGSNPNAISAGTITALNSAFTTLLSAMLATGVLGGQTFVLNKNKNNPVTQVVLQPASWTMQQFLATQRRRLRRVTRK